MKENWSSRLFWLGCATGLILMALGAVFYIVPSVEQRTIAAYQREAVKVGTGRWTPDENGAPIFAWRACSALGTKPH